MKRGRKPKVVPSSEFKIVKIDPADVDWARCGGSKYQEIYDAVRKLKIGEALSVKAPARGLGPQVRKNVYKTCKGVYVIRAKFNEQAGVWYFSKTN